MSDSRNGNFDLGKTVQDVANNDIVHTAAYFVPGLGTAMLGQDAYHDFEKGDWGSGLFNTGLAALDLIPYGSVVAGAVKGGAKAITKGAKAVVTKAPKVAKPVVKPYEHLQPGSKDYAPPTVKPKTSKGNVLKPAEVAKVTGKVVKAGKGRTIGAFVNGLLVADALNGGGGGTPDAGLGAGATDRMLNGAVSRPAAFQAGASS